MRHGFSRIKGKRKKVEKDRDLVEGIRILASGTKRRKLRC